MRNKILVVEDDSDVRTTIEMILKYAGYKVFSSATGQDIFQTIESYNPDLILLDINLGEIDGRVICKDLKSSAETSHIPIVIVSGDANIYNIILEEKANDIISKPFTEEILLSRVQRYVSPPTA